MMDIPTPLRGVYPCRPLHPGGTGADDLRTNSSVSRSASKKPG